VPLTGPERVDWMALARVRHGGVTQYREAYLEREQSPDYRQLFWGWWRGPERRAYKIRTGTVSFSPSSPLHCSCGLANSKD
jgi:hypothetical protein